MVSTADRETEIGEARLELESSSEDADLDGLGLLGALASQRREVR